VKIIDIHPHVMSPDRERYPLSPVFDHVADYVTKSPISAEMMLADMDEAGVTQSVLVHSTMAYGYNNAYAADTAAAYPERFASVGGINVRAAGAAETLRYWIRERGMNGMRIFTSGGTMAEDSDYLDDPATFPVWEMAAELGVPVCLQMRAGGYARLKALYERFPTVPLIIDHLARPPASDGPPYAAAAALWKLADAPSVYLKLSTYNFRELGDGLGTVQSFVQRCVDLFGASRIAWGSNYPASEGTLPEMVALAQRELAFLGETDRNAIFSGTALALYPALERAGKTAGLRP
jgi:predicted TIM-barrel fold metal-dependent hydrolase